jgi:hypothetical protein
MKEERMDRNLHAWLGGPLERLPEASLEATFAVTSRTRQRSRLVATLAGTPTMRDPRTRLPVTRQILVAAALLLALAAALVIAGQLFKDRRIVFVSTDPPFTTSPSAAAPSGPPSSSGPEETPDVTTVFQVPGSTAQFRTTLSGDWRRSGEDPVAGEVRITARTEIGPGFDPVYPAWVTIRATPDPIEAVEAELAAAGWTGTPEAIDIPDLSGVIVTAPGDGSLDPIALVTAQGVTYRILGHDDDGSAPSRTVLESFLRRFAPLGPAPPAEVYADAAWGFAFSYSAAAGAFLPGTELGNGVTRFASDTCQAGTASSCAAFVDVVRLPNASPLHLHLPDNRDVELRIYTKSAEYVRLAAEWEAKVGASRGSSAIYWLGTIVYDVENVTIHARFIHRGAQWLVLLSSEDLGAADYRLDMFLNGFTLLTPEPAASPGP